MPHSVSARRSVVLILGDQLRLDHPGLRDVDPSQDCVVMIEARGEGSLVWSHKARIALFLSAMRHFAVQLREHFKQRFPAHQSDDFFFYHRLTQASPVALQDILRDLLQQTQANSLVVCEPGEWRMQQDLQALCQTLGVIYDERPDDHFMLPRQDFSAWAKPLKQHRMEFFYRMMRQRYGVLMETDKLPLGGQWNWDADNREAFPKAGPGLIIEPLWFDPDDMTQQVLTEVADIFPDHPGELNDFRWPVTRDQALQALAHFIEHRLPSFGRWQDAMWTDTPFGWHALLASALNLHLLDPREVIAAAEHAYQQGLVDLPSCEGFIRQILGWREFIRGMYWFAMPGLREANYFDHQRALPDWFWTGKTQMQCMSQVIGQTMRYGYAHHIQRLMIIGNFAVLAGLHPKQVADWFLAVYVDAVEWVELPNVAGMALYADGGRFTSKPYISSGAYVKRMSNYCQHCRFKPAVQLGPDACPFTTLYWAFLDRHEQRLSGNPRMAMMLKNLQRLSAETRAAIRQQADDIMDKLACLA